MAPTLLENTAALASLHNFPTGKQYNPWGKAITLLRTEKGTPYFMNFHNKQGNGNCCIYGSDKSGKTVLMNFLISESTKFEPTIAYISDNTNSKIFVESIEGSWLEMGQKLLNPFLLQDTPETRLFIAEFLKIICGHYHNRLNELEINFLTKLTEAIFEIDESERIFSYILKNSDFSSTEAGTIKSRLSLYEEGGIFYGIFDDIKKIQLEPKNITGFNLINKYLPEGPLTQMKQDIEDFENIKSQFSALKFGIIYSIAYALNNNDKNPKILAIDNIGNLIDKHYFSHLEDILKKFNSNNAIILCNLNLKLIQPSDKELWHNWMSLIDTSIFLPVDIKLAPISEVLNLATLEINKLLSFSISSRMFLIKQDNECIIVELSIGGLKGLVRILSAHTLELEIFEKIKTEYPGHAENWISHLYASLDEKR
jgi:type IV secretion system protein VirB4